MRSFVKLIILQISILSVSSCVGIPPAPKVDIGIMRVEDLKDLKAGECQSSALFENAQGTEYQICANKLDKYLVIHPKQALDLIAWMNKVMVVLRSELYKR